MYPRGMGMREIQGHLEEIYGVEASPILISRVTDQVIEEVRAWQTSPLEAVYPLLYLDTLVMKVRDSGERTSHLDRGSRKSERPAGSTGAMDCAAERQQFLAGVRGKVADLSQRESGVAAQLGAHYPHVSISAGNPQAVSATNVVESLNRSLCKIIAFPTEEATVKLLHLALQRASRKWTMPIYHWEEALNYLVVLWPKRIPAAERSAE